MEKNIDHDEDFHKIKVFFSDDDKLKILGELLSNKSSRDIIKLLIDKEMYTNEIAKKLELKISLVIHHLQKMESINLLEITNKKIVRNGEAHRFFRIPTGMLILPTESKEKANDGLFKKVFKKGIKFAVIGFVSIFTWFSFSLLTSQKFFTDTPQTGSERLNRDPISGIPIPDSIIEVIQLDELLAYLISMLVLILGLVILNKKRKKRIS